MKIIRFIDNQDDIVLGCDYQDGTASLVEGDIYTTVTDTGNRVAVRKLLAPVVPTSILCIGLNYHAHSEETGHESIRYPTLFMKNLKTVTNPEDPIVIPAVCMEKPEVDYEAELAVVIGRDVRNATPETALDNVAGYTVANDVTARRWQKNAGRGQWVRGKSFDTFCPLGPCLVTPDEIGDPQQLALTCRLNGEVMQQANTSEMIFSVAEIIAYLSEDTTLPAGTIILSGTPGGVGFTRKPPVFLKKGDVMELNIEKIGTLINPVVETVG